MMSAQMITTTIANISLYIPHVFPNFTEGYIASVFEDLEIGCVDHVDLVSKLDNSGKPYNAAYIHFKYWYSGPIAENFQARVQDPSKEARIVHDDPWYWIILENTTKKNEPGARKACIDLSDQSQVQMVEIAPSLSNVVLSSEMNDENDEIDALISEVYNDPIDLSCDFDGFVDQEFINIQKDNYRLKAENKDLREEVEHLNDENIALREKLDEETYKLEYELFQTNMKLDEEQCEHGRTAQMLEHTEYVLEDTTDDIEEMYVFCNNILNTADTLEEAKDKISAKLLHMRATRNRSQD